MAGNVDHGREPCPDRILDDIGAAFGMGAVGGGIWHFGKGVYNSPRGLQNRALGGFSTMRFQAPNLGGSFAVWGGLFSAFDCTLVAVRKKEDPWNAIASGALTGGFLQLRHGLASAGRSAVFGGVLLAGIEGIGIMITRLTAPPPPPGLDDMLTQSPAGLAQTRMPASSTAPPVMPVELDAEAPPASNFGVEPAASTSASTPPASGRAAGGGWFGGLFGSGDGGAARKAAQSPVSTEHPVMPDFGTGSSSKESSGQGFTFR